MSNFSDIRQISDIHSISRISRSNCSRIIGRIDSLNNLYEQQSSTINNASKGTLNLNQGVGHLEKTAKCFTVCQDSISDFVKHKFILDCIKSVSLNNKGILSANVASQLNKLLMIFELKKYMCLPSTSKKLQGELNILGITNLPQYKLSYEESLDVKCRIESVLREKIHEFILRFESSGGSIKEILKTTDYDARTKLFESHHVQMVQWKYKIDELCTLYEADILKFNTLMNKWIKLRYNDMSQLNVKNATYLLLQARVAEVQAKITKLTCIMKMFNETPVTIDAFRILNSAIEEKSFKVMNEIKDKEHLKQLYENVHNTEYNVVLKTYLDLCKAIKKKKQILEKL